MRRIITFFVTIYSVIFLFVKPVSAEEVKVDHVAGGFEKVEEKINLFFRFNKQSKAKYYAYLTEKRFAELKYVIESKNYDLIETTSSRYTTYVNILAEMLIEDKLSSEKNDVIEMSKSQVEVIKRLQTNFEYDSGWWLAIQWSIDNLNSLPSRLSGL